MLEHLSPCGLDCGRCADFANSQIRSLSQQLLQLLAGYERVAQMKSDNNSLFNNYNHFKDILSSFAEGPCGGCRSNNVRCPIVCEAKTCHREKKVDFCFQCEEYPCERQFTGAMRERWIQRNNRLKEVGAIEFYREQKKIPRY